MKHAHETIEWRTQNGSHRVLCLLFTMCSVASNALAMGPAEELLTKFTEKPTLVEELVAKRTTASKVTEYLLVRYDGTNFLVRVAPTEHLLLRSTALRAGSAMAGHYEDVYWYLQMDTEPIMEISDGETRKSSESIAENAQRVKRMTENVADRPLKVITMGVDLFAKVRPKWVDGSTAWVDRNDKEWQASIVGTSQDSITLLVSIKGLSSRKWQYRYTLAESGTYFEKMERFLILPDVATPTWLDSFTIQKWQQGDDPLEKSLVLPENNFGEGLNLVRSYINGEFRIRQYDDAKEGSFILLGERYPTRYLRYAFFSGAAIATGLFLFAMKRIRKQKEST